MIKKKLKSNSGETIMESLVSIIIVVLVVAFLTTAIITAAGINKSLRDTDTSVKYSEAVKTGVGETATVNFAGTAIGVSVDAYESNGYIYYEIP